jgi:hypothetical protein
MVGRGKRKRKECIMRRFLHLATVLLVAVIAAGSPLTTLSSSPAAATVTTTPQVVAVPGIQSSPSLLCVLPQCDGPYCRGSNGCLVCCRN